MRIKNNEYALLVEICDFLDADGRRKDLALPLKDVLARYATEREKANERQRKSSAKNRMNGYSWPSSYHPKKSKYYQKGNEDE